MSDSDDIAVSTRIVVAVASAKDVDPLSLSPPLADELDPDALDRLVDAETQLHLSFTAWGCQITVREGSVSVVEDASLSAVPAD